MGEGTDARPAPPTSRITVGKYLMSYILFNGQNRFTTEKLIEQLNGTK
jgi:hypothetical protein